MEMKYVVFAVIAIVIAGIAILIDIQIKKSTAMDKLSNADEKAKIEKPHFAYDFPKVDMTTRNAYFSEKVLVSVDNSLNCTLASTTVSCPPAVSIAVCGEKINANTIELFKYYGVKEIYVTKNSQI